MFKLASSCALILSACLGITYWTEIFSMDPYSCRGAPYFWVNFSKYYLVACSVSLLLVVILNSLSWTSENRFKKLIFSLLLLPILGFGAFIASVVVAFYYKDQCPGLNDLLVMAFYITILICTSPLIIFALSWLEKVKTALVIRFNKAIKMDNAYVLAPDFKKSYAARSIDMVF